MAARSAEAAQVAAAQGGVLASLSTRDFRLTKQYEFIPALAGEVTREGLATLESLPGVLHVGLDQVRHAFLSESTALIGARDAQAAGYRGRGASVAVLDTGVDRNHPDLRSVTSSTEACTAVGGNGGGGCPDGTSSQTGLGSARDDEGHGTHVSGIIASQGSVAPAGVAPSALLVAVRVLGADGSGSDSGILAGLDFVMRFKIQVVNMSLGGGKYPGYCDADEPAMAAAVNRLVATGTAVVIASGNESYGDGISAPGCLSNAWSVGAVYSGSSDIPSRDCGDATAVADRVACFSNSYSLLDFLAPGTTITSSFPGGRTNTFDGTSQATPHVAGAAALIMGAAPSFTVAQVYQLLRSTGRRVTDVNGVTTPRIDLRAVLQSIR
ncbi:MAG: S8 family serine peptidase [Vicinamibacteria bacterium]|nr:S8 family serine peptidase [Vicinamibacteria bacterium]